MCRPCSVYYFAATNSQYQRRIVSGVARVATFSNAFRPSTLPSFAKRRRSPSVSRSRCLPSRSGSAAFSARWYSITRACCSPTHIPIHAARNCRGSNFSGNRYLRRGPHSALLRVVITAVNSVLPNRQVSGMTSDSHDPVLGHDGWTSVTGFDRPMQFWASGADKPDPIRTLMQARVARRLRHYCTVYEHLPGSLPSVSGTPIPALASAIAISGVAPQPWSLVLSGSMSLGVPSILKH